METQAKALVIQDIIEKRKTRTLGSITMIGALFAFGFIIFGFIVGVIPLNPITGFLVGVLALNAVILSHTLSETSSE